MNEELKIKISAEISNFKQKIQQVKNDIKSVDKNSADVSKAVDRNFKALGNGIKKSFQVAAKASVAVATAIGGITVAAVKSFGEYEQLKGGVEKLFKSSSKTIMNYANDAYKTSGLTANQYMETVTGFSAGLIASMGGDTAAAAEVADMAINDMADNASVFGTSITDIQNAYQGFAKQNYTMLDNLKLGYGGTREEMQRLLDDAQKISGVEYDMSNLDDVYNAIHVVQQQMEITGNASQEASKTIEGSINSAKSAWSNLITGLADSNANIPQLVQNVISSSADVLNNIIPIVKEVLKNIPKAIGEISPAAGKAFQTILDIATPIFSTLGTLVGGVINGIITGLGFIQQHSTAFTILAVGVGILTTAIMAYNAVQTISHGLQAAKIALNVAETTSIWGVAAAMAAVIAPYVAVVAAIAAVVAIIAVCIKHWDKIKATIANVWKEIKRFCKDGANAVKQAFTDMKNAIGNIVGNIKNAVTEKFEAIKNAMKEKVEGAKSAVKDKFESIKNTIKDKSEGAKAVVKDKFESIKSSIKEKTSLAKDAVKAQFSEMGSAISSKVSSIKSAVGDKFGALKDLMTNPVSKAKDKVKSLIDKMRSFFNFSWSLPHLKLPHLSITGKLSLKPPSVPKFGISWYAKGGVFESPTLFNYGNGAIGGLGEAGAEAVVPLENNTKWLDRLANMLTEKQGGNRPIVLQIDGKTFAQMTVDSINDLTRQRGSLALQIV